MLHLPHYRDRSCGYSRHENQIIAPQAKVSEWAAVDQQSLQIDPKHLISAVDDTLFRKVSVRTSFDSAPGKYLQQGWCLIKSDLPGVLHISKQSHVIRAIFRHHDSCR